MRASYREASLAALGLVTASCGFDWEGVYNSRFGGDAQGGSGVAVTVAGYGGSSGGSDPGQGGTASGGTGAAAASGGSSAAGAGGVAGGGTCAGNLVENPGFELADKKGVPTGWQLLSPQSSSDGSFSSVTTTAYEGASSLFLDTTALKKPPADYLLVVATSQAYDVTAIPTLYLSAAAWVNDPLTPMWVAVLYFDSSGGLLGVLTGGNVLTVDHLEFAPAASFVAEGSLASSVPRLAATARVGLIAGQGVSAYIDSVCLTR